MSTREELNQIQKQNEKQRQNKNQSVNQSNNQNQSQQNNEYQFSWQPRTETGNGALTSPFPQKRKTGRTSPRMCWAATPA